MPLIDFTPPAQSWPDYLASLPPGRVPTPEDMYARWDSPRYVCPNRPRNGTTAQFAQHDTESPSAGHCKCGAPFRKEGLQGVGERHAYLAWLGGLMSAEEGQFFWGAVASARPERLTELGTVPILKEVFKWLIALEDGE